MNSTNLYSSYMLITETKKGLIPHAASDADTTKDGDGASVWWVGLGITVVASGTTEPRNGWVQRLRQEPRTQAPVR